MLDFFKLTKDEIHQGIELMNQSGPIDPTHPLKEFEYSIRLHILVSLWIDCNEDMTLMKLKYFDQINVLNSMSITTQRVNGHA